MMRYERDTIAPYSSHIDISLQLDNDVYRKGSTMTNPSDLLQTSGIMPPDANAARREFRAKRGDVKLALLSVLSEGPASGYELMKKIRAKSAGQWRISSGSIYPQLESLSDHGLVNQTYSEDIYTSSEYVYSLTGAGAKHVETKRTQMRDVWANFSAVKFQGSELQIELQKLAQALSVLDGASPAAVSKITDNVAVLRKRIYAILAE